MALSLSSLVRSFVLSFVMKEFFFSIRRFNGVSGKSNGCSVKYQGRFIKVSWIGSFKGVSRKFQDSFKED